MNWPDEIAESLLRGLTDPAPRPYPLSRGQAALWAIHANRPGTTSCNLPLGLWLGDGIDPEVLTRALIAVVERQLGLRIAVRLDGTTPVQEITERPAEVVRLDLGHVTGREFAARIRRLVHTPFDLEHDPLHRMWLIAAPGGRTLLLLVFHNSVSSTAAVNTAPSDRSWRTIRWDREMPSRSGFQLAREKKAWARSWDQARVNPAPVSMPVTVPRPVCAIKPVTSAANVVNVGVVKQPRRNVSTANSEAGTVESGSIGGSPHSR